MYYWQISKDSIILVSVGFAISIVGAILPFFLPETPVYLLSLRRTDQTIAVMKKIAKVNKKERKF